VKVEVGDLLNATEVAEVLGLSHRTAIATYRSRYPDFPTPVMTKGKCVLWLRADIRAWATARARRSS
jgi:predicted DNA-binding transcriptional regulator AlpA